MARKSDNRYLKSTEPALKLEDFLPYRLNVLSETVSLALSRLYSERYGIGIPEWRAIATLGQFDVITAKDVGAHSHMHKTKVSRAVAALERKGFVARRPNPDDMREAFLMLTPKGQATYRELAPLALDFASQLSAELDDGELAALERVLSRLSDRAQTIAAEVSSRSAK